MIGDDVGEYDGFIEGSCVGFIDGEVVGDKVGEYDGWMDGALVNPVLIPLISNEEIKYRSRCICGAINNLKSFPFETENG